VLIDNTHHTLALDDLAFGVSIFKCFKGSSDAHDNNVIIALWIAVRKWGSDAQGVGCLSRTQG
jgi:hypothetical protein